MRFLTISLFFVCLFLFGIGYLAFGHDDIETTSKSYAYYAGGASLDAELETFYKLIKTDPEAARLELQSVAKELFDEHPLTEKWVALFYKVFYEISLKDTEQKGSEPPWELISDIKHLYELGLEMLTGMDTEKYAKQIQLHQDALKHYTKLAAIAEAVGNKASKPEKGISDTQKHISQPPSELSDMDAEEQILNQHIEKFYQLISTDPEAARKELETYAAKFYQGHPLTQEWIELFCRMGSEGAATVPD